VKPIPFNVPFLSGDEERYLTEAFGNRVFGGHGPFTRRCQAWLEDALGVPKSLLTTSCTAALEMSALLLDIGPNDEVIVPSYTFVATASAFLRAGATIVFCEIDPSTMTMDPDDVASRMTERTRAIVPVHYAGYAAPMQALADLAHAHDAVVVEDAAQGLDASYNDVRLGTFAPLACLSFHETKNIHCGLGGALLINDPSMVERAEFAWHRGTDRSRMLRGMTDKYTWVEMGSSFYPSDLQAAFLLAQLEALERNTRERRAVWDAYEAALRPLADAGLLHLPTLAPGMKHNAHAYFLLTRTADEREQLRLHLAGLGISAYSHYVPLHSSPMGHRLGYHRDDLPVTEDSAARLLRLPMHTSLTPHDVERVITAVQIFYDV